MKYLLKSLVFIGIILISLEILLRICFPVPEFSNFNRINYQILDRVDDKKGYLRNIEMLWKSSLDTSHAFQHKLNKYGYRDKLEWKAEKKKGKKRFFLIGDSFVEGMMSDYEQTIPETFSKAVKEEHREIEVFNCGMMGIGLNEYIKFIKDAVPIYKPDEVLLTLYSNDLPFQRKYEPQEILIPQKNNLWYPRLFRVIQQIKRKDPIPFQFNPEQRPFYKPVPDAGNPWSVNENTLTNEVTAKIAAAMKKGDFNYFRTNWILQEAQFLKTPIDVKSKLQFIRDYLKQYGTKLIIFYIPSRSQVSNYYFQFDKQACLTKCPDFLDLTGGEYQQHAKIIAQNCRDLNVPFKDFTGLIRQHEANGNHLYWNYDDHMKGKGYELLGGEMFSFWKLTHTKQQ